MLPPAYFHRMRLIAATVLFLFSACTDPLPSDIETGIETVDFSFLQEENRLYFSIRLTDTAASPDTVFVEWFGSDTSNAPDTLGLADDGSEGDILSGDAVWSREVGNTAGNLANPVSIQMTGTVYCRGHAVIGGTAYSLDASFSLGNLIPRIVDITAPDTVALPPSANVSTTFLVECEVYDANGADDIRRVSFKSYLAENDSAMNGGNAIEMVDDGGVGSYSGDETADDQIYSVTVNLPVTAVLGTYLWVFQAQDQSLEYSVKDSHYIVVEPYSE